MGSFLERFWGPNSIPKAIQNLIDFWIDFFNDFGSFGGPSWSHVGDILAKNKATLSNALVFLVAIAFSVGSGRTRDRFWTDFGASGTDFGPILGRCWADVGRFWDDFWFNFDPIEEASSSIAKLSSAIHIRTPRCYSQRAGGDTRSVRNYQKIVFGHRRKHGQKIVF